jgi:NADPH-dependent glutamate synthase beta subunit-like oxidoreductase
VNEPIAICALKRYAADKGGDVFERATKGKDATGRKVAVIGAGPAGLTAAFYLRKKGHEVTIFEARKKPGGMMRYGIPDHRLPEEILDQEIDRVLGIGIGLETEKSLGNDFDLDGLKQSGYEAVFIATGLPESRKIDLEGADLDDVLWGVDFLADVTEGGSVALKEKVLVVGGGNVAIDVALSALRLGAKDVTMACLEAPEEMPANPWEIKMAREEGVKLMTSWGPKKIIHDHDRISGVELVQCASVFDDGGNFCPAFNDVTETVAADQVILAVGQSADLSFLGESGGLQTEGGLQTGGGMIRVDPETLETGLPGVFAGGDVGQGPGAVIDAVAAGRRAAGAIDRHLGGDGNIDETLVQRPDDHGYTGKRERGFADLSRIPVPALPVEERHDGFPEVERCFEDGQAVQEAKRCLQCDLEQRFIQEGRIR